MIPSKDYDTLLFDILRPLLLDKDGKPVPEKDRIRIYHNVIDDDFNSQADDYIVYSTGLSNTPFLYGDGKTLVRRSSCDITVNEAGDGNRADSGYLVKAVEELLIKRGISYTKINLGYIESQDSIQTTFDFYLK